MNNFKGNRGGFKKGGSKSKFEGKKSFGGDKKHEASRKYGGNKGRGDRTTGSAPDMFPATCSECSKRCEVPFRPSQDKPVYCGDCFGVKKNANEKRGSENEGGREGKSSYKNDRPDYTKLPREERPARHNKNRGRGDDGIVDLKKQIADLDIKLNRILDLMSTPASVQKAALPTQKQVAKKVAPKKAPKKAEVKKPSVKKVVKKSVTKKVAPKKVVKKTVAKKAIAKTIPKKVVKKATVKKVVKKVTAKKVVKKAVAKKIVKKAKK